MNHKFSGNPQVRLVTTFDELTSQAFQEQTNAICWYRNLDGDFKEVVSKLQFKEKITDISIPELLVLTLSQQGSIARKTILDDLKLLKDLGAKPALNLIKCYERDEEYNFISTDVYSYHVDRSPVPTDTFLCTYYGPSTEIIGNDDAKQKILIPEVREKLENLYNGPRAEFETFLEECFFDLHYEPKKDVVPLSLGLGHLWKLAVDHPGQQAFPCIHRAPVEHDEYRLVLIC